jgi:WhiB family redox-sensing transcriptional regulator
MGIFERRVLEFVLAWAPFPGPTDEDVLLEFGISAAQLTDRFEQITGRMTGRTATLAPSDRSLVCRASAHLSRSQEPSSITRSGGQLAAIKAAVAIPPAPSARRPYPDTESQDDGRGRDWYLRARCRGLPIDIFYPAESERGVSRDRRFEAAKTICRQCAVHITCRDHAIAAREPHGVWGAMTPKERAEFCRSSER